MSPPPPLNGRLHIYSEANNLVCFESGDAAANNVLAFYGGFNTGLYSMPVLADLSGSLPPDWSLVQALSRSSDQGVLTAKQTETAEDMHDLEVYLRQTQHKTGRMVFMGASKGCGDVIAFFDVYGQSTTADAGILLSPTGGRENLLRYFTQEDLTNSLALASAQSEAGFGAYAFPPDVLNGNKLLQSCKGMHADVWLHIMAAGGPAENFASDSTDEQLEDLFSSFRVRSKNICILMAGDDESVPATVDKELLLRRFLRAAGCQGSIARGHVVKGANHAVEQKEARDVVVDEVVAFLELTHKV